MVGIFFSHTMFLMVKVSPSTHGNHPQVLVSPSSNMPATQAFKGLREDEVLYIRC